MSLAEFASSLKLEVAALEPDTHLDPDGKVTSTAYTLSKTSSRSRRGSTCRSRRGPTPRDKRPSAFRWKRGQPCFLIGTAGDPPAVGGGLVPPSQRPSPNQLHQGQVLGGAPMLGHLAVHNTDDVRAVEPDALARCLDAGHPTAGAGQDHSAAYDVDRRQEHVPGRGGGLLGREAFEHVGVERSGSKATGERCPRRRQGIATR